MEFGVYFFNISVILINKSIDLTSDYPFLLV